MTWQAWQARTTYWHFCYTFHTAGVLQESKGGVADRGMGRVPPLEPGATTTCASVYVGVSIFVVDVLPPCRSLHISRSSNTTTTYAISTINDPHNATLNNNNNNNNSSSNDFDLARRRWRSIIKFYFRHSIWEMSSVYDGFLTCLVIEYAVGSFPFGLVFFFATFLL